MGKTKVTRVFGSIREYHEWLRGGQAPEQRKVEENRGEKCRTPENPTNRMRSL
jgi:hypothetical protein